MILAKQPNGNYYFQMNGEKHINLTADEVVEQYMTYQQTYIEDVIADESRQEGIRRLIKEHLTDEEYASMGFEKTYDELARLL